MDLKSGTSHILPELHPCFGAQIIRSPKNLVVEVPGKIENVKITRENMF